MLYLKKIDRNTNRYKAKNYGALNKNRTSLIMAYYSKFLNTNEL